MRNLFTWRMAVVLAVLLSGLPAGALARAAAQGAPAGGAEAPMPQEKLDSLVAPIALYPDQLLAQALMAATYPLDVVDAARFVKANPSLKGAALDKAVAAKNWDPSVQSLTAFPQVLDMMDKKLDWTQELGNAFLADEARVFQTVQKLRQRAESAGTLKSSEQVKVVKEQSVIVIEPAKPDVVYVPAYDPATVYGAWPAPAYPPYYYQPPPAYYPAGGMLAAGVIGFGLGVAASDNHWGWSEPDWHGGTVNVNTTRNNTFVKNNQRYSAAASGGKWQFNSAQRKGVAYGDAATRAKYQKANPNDVAARREARGYGAGAEGAGAARREGGAAGTAPGARGGAGQAERGGRAEGMAGTGTGRAGGQAGTADGRGGREAGAAGGREAGAAGGRAGGQAAMGGGRAGAQPEFASGRSGATGRSGGARSSFDPGQSRQQAQGFSSRGASSRASMGGGAGRGGGGRAGGGGRRGR